MGTTTGVINKVTIFDPVIKIADVDVGFISDKITVTYSYESARYESGIPKNLRKTVKVGEKLMCKFELAQTTIGNFQSAMNLPDTSLVSTSIITIGGDSSIRALGTFEFQGTDDRGKEWNVKFYKAVFTEIGEFNIDSDWVKIPVTVEAVADLSRPRGDQMGILVRSTS